MTSDPRHGPRYRILVSNQRAKHLPCWLCLQPIDYTLAAPDPGSFSYDHAIPVTVRPDLAMDPANGRSSHLACNQQRGNRAPSSSSLGTPSEVW